MDIDELAVGICLRAGRIAATEAELLAWIAEFDRREGWAGPGMLSCAHWMSWRIGLSPGAAREKVRVARRLEELPAIAAAFAAGQLSYSKVRALSRAAQPGDGIDWVAVGQNASAGQLERIVRGCERARAHDRAATDPELAQGELQTTVRYDEHGGFTMTIRGPAHYVPMLRAGLDAKRDELQRRTLGSPDRAPARREARAAPAVTDAEALLAMATDAVAAEAADHPAVARRRRPQLVVQVDPLTGWGRQADGELLPPTSMRAVVRALPGRGPGPSRLVGGLDPRRFDLGRSQRDVSDRLRELLGTLDAERCRFPGCTRRRKLHATPHRLLVARWPYRPEQPRAALQSASHLGPRARLPARAPPRPSPRRPHRRR